MQNKVFHTSSYTTKFLQLLSKYEQKRFMSIFPEKLQKRARLNRARFALLFYGAGRCFGPLYHGASFCSVLSLYPAAKYSASFCASEMS